MRAQKGKAPAPQQTPQSWVDRLSRWVGLIGGILGILGGMAGSWGAYVSYRNESLAQRREVHRLVDQAWDALGGAEGTSLVELPTRLDPSQGEKARRHLRDALALEPNNLRALVARCVLSCAEGQVKAARESCELAVRIYPNELDAQSGMGQLYLHQRRAKEAIPFFLRATELRPSNPHAFRNLSEALRGDERYEEALTAARRAAELSPQSALSTPARKFGDVFCGSSGLGTGGEVFEE